MTKPGELLWAETLDSLCQRYHCLPSALEKEDVSLLMALAILKEGSNE